MVTFGLDVIFMTLFYYRMEAPCKIATITNVYTLIYYCKCQMLEKYFVSACEKFNYYKKLKRIYIKLKCFNKNIKESWSLQKGLKDL